MERALVRSRSPVPPDVEGYHAPAQELPAPSRFWRILGRNRFPIAAFALAVVGTTAYFTWRVTPTYEASASIRIEQTEARLGALPSSSAQLPNELPTEFQVLQSRALLEAVVDSLGLQIELRVPAGASRENLLRLQALPRNAVPGKYRLELEPDGRLRIRDRGTGTVLGTVGQEAVFDLRGAKLTLASEASRYSVVDLDVRSFDDAVEQLQKSVKVRRRTPEANILDVSYRGTDPQLVQKVPNVLTARFVAARQGELHAQARSTAKFLSEQIAKLSGSLRSAEDRLRAFQEKRGVVSLPDEATTGLAQAAELQSKRSTLEAERTALAELVQAVRDSIELSRTTGVLAYRNLVAFPTLLHNEAMAQLLSSLTVVEDRRSDLLSRRTLQDPDVQVLTARANQIGDQIGAIAMVYLQGLTNQVGALDSVLGQSQRRLDRIPAKELEFARLQREAKGLEEIVTLLQSRLKEAEIAQAVEDPTVRLVDAAVLPIKPVSPKPLFNLGLALVLGIGLATAGALFREYLDRTVRSRRDMLVATGVPVLGLLPHSRVPRLGTPLRFGRNGVELRQSNGRHSGNGATAKPVATSAGLIRSDSPVDVVEAYNLLDTNLAFAAGTQPTKVLMVTSPLPGEGKTTVAVNLALTLAQRGSRVLLMDADLRCGSIANLFGLTREPGLSDVLLGVTRFGDAARSCPVSETSSLHVLSRGRECSNPVQLLGSAEALALLRSLREEYEAIIVDTPPANVVADASVIGAHTDGVILVARAAVTDLQALTFAVDQLTHVRAQVIGAVLNDIDFQRDAAYDEAYRYYSHRKAYAEGLG